MPRWERPSSGTYERWTVLTAPGGQVYCLTDRDPLSGTVRRPVRQ